MVKLILIKMLDEKEITDPGWQQFSTQVGGFYNIKNIMIDTILSVVV